MSRSARQVLAAPEGLSSRTAAAPWRMRDRIDRRDARPGVDELGRVGQRSGDGLSDPEPAVRTLSPRGRSEVPHRRRHRRPGARPGARGARRHRRHERVHAQPDPARAQGAARRAVARAAHRQPQQSALQACLVPQAAVEMGLPCHIGDYTDFYTSIHHATAVGKQFRPDNPLLPNYKWVPIGYHGRASSIGVSGASDSPPARPIQRRRRRDARLRSDPAARLRAGTRHLHRAAPTPRASRCRSPTPKRISSASRSSTTGPRATSRRGSTSRSVRSCRRTSRRRCRRGS